MLIILEKTQVKNMIGIGKNYNETENTLRFFRSSAYHIRTIFLRVACQNWMEE